MDTRANPPWKNVNKKHILVVSGVWPHITGSFEAANVVSYSIVKNLIETGAFAVSYAFVNTNRAEIPESARPEIEDLIARGVRFLDPLLIEDSSRMRGRPLKIIQTLLLKPEGFLLGFGREGDLTEKLKGERIDATLTVWSELGTTIACRFKCLKFAYYGNPEHKVFGASLLAKDLAGEEKIFLRSFLEKVKTKVTEKLIERANIRVLRRYNLVADVAQNDALYYKKQGVKAIYLQNMWPKLPPENWEAIRDKLESENPGKIIGNVGNLSATGNTLGFLALTKHVLPALERKLGANSFVIHLLGGGNPKPFMAELLNSPLIKIRGFVSDIDYEIISAPIFLICNNFYKFKVGHTRFLHAWSLGACVIAFGDCRESMPEIEHGYNALLGSTAEEVSHLVERALHDRDLRRSIGRGGVQTLLDKFSPKMVTSTLLEHMQSLGLRRVER